MGVRAVVSLTEPFETLVPSTKYLAHGMEHLQIPTPDYYAAPSIEDICGALDFMHGHALKGNGIYVHCKAGRGRSTTVVLCYLIRFKNMTPEAAWNQTWSKRPRIALTSAQEKVVLQFDRLNRIGGLPL
uniref:Uncharacterized protein n=1 Tax=Avena sativa TaxID=4498 RepID=A0ACD5U0K8_AVESA